MSIGFLVRYTSAYIRAQPWVGSFNKLHMPLSFHFLICKMEIPVCCQEPHEKVSQSWCRNGRYIPGLSCLCRCSQTVPTDSLHFHHPWKRVIPQEAGPCRLHCLMTQPHTIGPRHKPGTSFTFSFAFDSPQQKRGSRQCFRHDYATGCQVKSDLSCYKQTKQNSFQDVGLLFV